MATEQTVLEAIEKELSKPWVPGRTYPNHLNRSIFPCESGRIVVFGQPGQFLAADAADSEKREWVHYWAGAIEKTVLEMMGVK